MDLGSELVIELIEYEIRVYPWWRSVYYQLFLVGFSFVVNSEIVVDTAASAVAVVVFRSW